MTSMTDLAQAVRDAAKKRLDDGELKPNLRDGLAAQALLDRREEKQKDRTFMLSLARLTSGSAAEIPENIVVFEGESHRLDEGDSYRVGSEPSDSDGPSDGE